MTNAPIKSSLESIIDVTTLCLSEPFLNLLNNVVGVLALVNKQEIQKFQSRSYFINLSSNKVLNLLSFQKLLRQEENQLFLQDQVLIQYDSVQSSSSFVYSTELQELIPVSSLFYLLQYKHSTFSQIINKYRYLDNETGDFNENAILYEQYADINNKPQDFLIEYFKSAKFKLISSETMNISSNFKFESVFPIKYDKNQLILRLDGIYYYNQFYGIQIIQSFIEKYSKLVNLKLFFQQLYQRVVTNMNNPINVQFFDENAEDSVGTYVFSVEQYFKQYMTQLKQLSLNSRLYISGELFNLEMVKGYIANQSIIILQ